MEINNKYSRRRFIRTLTYGTGALVLAPQLASLASCFPAASNKKLGIALVGLGGYSSGQLAPALQETKNCYLAGIVTGTPSKAESWSQKYNIPEKNIYNYSNFDSIAKNPDIDIVYVVLPVSMHKEYTIRAAKAGKHVICEKPMALNAGECREMIAACKQAGKMLSIGYRLHFEPHTLEVMRLAKEKPYGKITSIDTANGFTYRGDPKSWRLKKALSGGGALMDMGIYTIQGSRYATGLEPLFVTATEEKTNRELFKEVDETIHYKLEFPGGIVANGKSSYNENVGFLKIHAEKGDYGLQPAFGYGGIQGETPAGVMDFPQINQQAFQMDDFALCVSNKRMTRVAGEEGLRDMQIIDAIYRSIASGNRERIV
ncbi:glucose-fructose oxidoreductase [Arcticibacter svalbardensis MN12-7]|uniref:Glucose-fructose oxidoreductase n=1 Tax=Arcticibacter svalbardensis MN12-7 TaxID=1150600 RepID=R9GMI4_9SPHI|nr:Gfo/Idh/MocA family oxidoreductase [Arcticibacter svalbardensis]EOR92943.1 glucose-fructose oxidoreductase [Arcticibacter svalbardensis MN12-7]